ncbi:MAG: type II toxin-antitoxin system RelE/ParE family toxin [Gammaproteobacteria bacterium]
MIKSSADKTTAALFAAAEVRGVSRELQRRARLKLGLIDAAVSLVDLQRLRDNRLEALQGTRKGQYSIRINAQWRLCFAWRAGDAYSVELTDYH